MNLSTWPLQQMLGKNLKTSSKDKTLITHRLKLKHQQEFIERFKWNNLPPELNKDLIERILYFRFKGAFFKWGEKYWFLPFTLNGSIDSYGRYESIKPVLFTGMFDTSIGQWKESSFLPDTVDQKIPVAYGKYEVEEGFEPAIILTDTSLEISQDILPEYLTIDPLIEQLTDILVLINIDLINSAKIYTIVAEDEDQKIAIEKEFENLDNRILSGKRVIVVLGDGSKDLQELTGPAASKDSARYFQSYQSFDNLRKELIGIDNGGQFLKQEHMTDGEIKKNSGGASYVLNNALRMRQEFCELVNHYYGLNISVELNGDVQTNTIVEEEGEQTKQLRGDDEDASV